MKRNVLLIEPNYKNKYPPIALMKLATYHKLIGDNVIFYKGDMKDFIIEQATNLCIEELHKINVDMDWGLLYDPIYNYIKTRKLFLLKEISTQSSEQKCLKKYKDYYWKKEYKTNPIWDRICITTLFTFYWDITIDTIQIAKDLVKTIDELWIGGVMATILSDKIKSITGILPWKGLLDKKHVLDNDNDYIIDEMPLDYSILDEVSYKYSKNSAYYGYMTRGCIRKCPFCAVPTLEPTFHHFISFKDKIEQTKRYFGEQQNLLLLDNNVLASSRFPDIIEEIKAMGFHKDAHFIESNQYDIAIRNLRLGFNDRAYIKKVVILVNKLLEKLRGRKKELLLDILKEFDIEDNRIVSKEKLIKSYPLISPIFEKYRNKRAKQRFIDFNQGLDARLINDRNIALLSQVAIRPLRIAFDSIRDQDKYVKAIVCASKYGIKHFSNYLLYNFKDTPIDLYKRMEINVMLCDELDVNIYSFPMKYHPISDDLFYANRDYLGGNWNRKFIRAIQTILNATKGKVGKGDSFFRESFGENEDEFMEILYMPEPYILYRKYYREIGLTAQWRTAFNRLSGDDKILLKKIVELNDFNNAHFDCSQNVQNVLSHYFTSREKVF